MNSLDLLNQSHAHSNLPHLQNQYHHHHHQQQQEQMNVAKFQDRLFGRSEGRADLQFCSEQGARQEDSTSSSNSGGESAQSVVHSQNDSSRGQQVDAQITKNYQSGQIATETENNNSSQLYEQQPDRVGPGESTEDRLEVHGMDDNGNDNNEKRLEIEANNDCDGGEDDDDDDDDEAFVALCTDASSVLNKHDPSRRYYINKLYQPLNGNQDDTPLEEQDDEYLLYQELRFLESVAQESTDDRQRVQLTKILEDDEGDEDVVDHLVGADQREDNLDRLHLTTIIEAFESFPSSPLMGTCRDSDPLIGGACDVTNPCQDKPDSTRHGDSPLRSNSTNNSMNSTPNYITSAHDHTEQYDCDQSLRHNHQDPHLLSVSSGTSIIHDSHHDNINNHDHHNRQQYHHQINQDTSSENSSFQQVSSTFIHSIESNESSTSSSTNRLLSFNNEVQPYHQQLQESSADIATHNKMTSKVVGQPKKRNLQQVIHENETRAPKQAKNRPKKKSTTATTKPDELATKSKDTPIDGVTSSMMNQIETARCSILDTVNSINSRSSSSSCSSNNNRLESHLQQQEYVTMEDGDEGTMSMEDDSAPDGSLGGKHISKYRRRTANARERIRMREINQAFEKLKKVVPIEMIQQAASGDESDQTSASSRRGDKSISNNGAQQSESQSIKLTKITTLRLAVSYIAKLSEVLSQHPEGSSVNQQQTVSPQPNGGGTSVVGGRYAATEPLTKVVRNNDTTRTRRRRSRTTSRQKLAQDSKVMVKVKTDDLTEEADKSLRHDSTPDSNGDQIIRNVSSELRVEPGAFVLNQSANQQHRQILIANNVLNAGGLHHQASTFLPLQQPQQLQQQNTHNQEQRMPQQQFAYAHCNRQPLTISQTTSTNAQDRTFVTPVTVAILGIPTSSSNRGPNEHQGQLQIIGIQNPQQLQQRTTQHIQTGGPSYNLITQQPQQVAFTLDDINGVSVLRLANTQNHGLNAHPQAIQFQHHTGGSIIQRQQQQQQQQPQILTATTQTTGYHNYTTPATYQPVHISQIQSTNMATIRPYNQQQQQQQQTATVQFRTNSINGRTQETHLLQFSNDIRATIDNQRNIAISDNHFATTTTKTNSSNPTINTGTNNGDCRNNFGISPTMIAQHLNNDNINSNNFNNISNSINNSNILQGSRIFQTQPVVTGCNTTISSHLPAATQANLIYINPTSLSYSTNNLPRAVCQQTQQTATVQQTSICNRPSNNTIIAASTTTTTSPPAATTTPTIQTGGGGGALNSNTIINVQPYDQVRFVAQSDVSQVTNNGQTNNKRANEANIRQLVASLATSIQPKVVGGVKSDGSSSGGSVSQNEQVSEQQRHQPKRTYRFHDYDGNTITNHLYNNHDKSNGQQQQLAKRSSQQQVQQQPQQQQQQQQQLVQSDQSPATAAVTRKTGHPNSNNIQRSRQNSLSSNCSTNSCSSSSLISLSTASPTLSVVVSKSPPLFLEKSGGDTTTTTNSQARSMIEATVAGAGAAATEVVGCN